jgi:hypothetical protein
MNPHQLHREPAYLERVQAGMPALPSGTVSPRLTHAPLAAGAKSVADFVQRCRYGGGAAARERGVAEARPTWYLRALGGLHLRRQRDAMDAPAPAARA